MGSRPKRRRDAGFDQFDDAHNRGLGIISLNKIKVALGFGFAKVGYDALVDAVGIHDDLALGRLPEDFGEADHWHRAGWIDIGQHLAGPNRGKLVDVANDQNGGLVRHRLHERLHQHDIDHGGLSTNRSQLERVVGHRA